MSCIKPIRAYLAADGRPKFFKKTDPQYWEQPYTGLSLPCWYCELCRKKQTLDWTMRLVHEATFHNSACMVTLTYDEAHLPSDLSCKKADLQKFFKRLRKHGYQFSYFAVMEYGDQSGRAHYHVIFFGQDFTNGRIWITNTNTKHLWTSLTLQNTWGLGKVSVAPFNQETAAYAASYVQKKQRAKQTYSRVDESTGELIALEQPRAFMSKNIAKRWFDTWGQKRITDHDNVIHNARPQKPPRQYDKWLKEKNPAAHEHNKTARIQYALKNARTQTQSVAQAMAATDYRRRQIKTI